jgi:hypothetical protein
MSLKKEQTPSLEKKEETTDQVITSKEPEIEQ